MSQIYIQVICQDNLQKSYNKVKASIARLQVLKKRRKKLLALGVVALLCCCATMILGIMSMPIGGVALIPFFSSLTPLTPMLPPLAVFISALALTIPSALTIHNALHNHIATTGKRHISNITNLSSPSDKNQILMT